MQRAESKWLEEDGGCLIRRAFYTSIEQSTIIRLATEKYTFENTRFIDFENTRLEKNKHFWKVALKNTQVFERNTLLKGGNALQTIHF